MAITPERRPRHLAALLAAACAFVAVTANADAANADAANADTANADTANADAASADAALARARTPATPPDTTRLTGAQRAVLLDATRQFRDVKRAVAAGYLPTKDCVPGMGFHYAKPALAADPNIDPTLPEVLVYTSAGGGTVRLAALEYFRADADQNLKTDDDRPTLFGHPFNGPMPGHPLPPGQPPMPIHYDLHVWLYQANPSGVLATTNPEVDCRPARPAG